MQMQSAWPLQHLSLQASGSVRISARVNAKGQVGQRRWQSSSTRPAHATFAAAREAQRLHKDRQIAFVDNLRHSSGYVLGHKRKIVVINCPPEVGATLFSCRGPCKREAAAYLRVTVVSLFAKCRRSGHLGL